MSLNLFNRITTVDNTSDNLKVKIMNRDRVIFEGEVKAITSENSLGEFDILPQHANFVSTIKSKIVLHKDKGAEEVFPVTLGVIDVGSNQIKVYLGLEAQ